MLKDVADDNAGYVTVDENYLTPRRMWILYTGKRLYPITADTYDAAYFIAIRLTIDDPPGKYELLEVMPQVTQPPTVTPYVGDRPADRDFDTATTDSHTPEKPSMYNIKCSIDISTPTGDPDDAAWWSPTTIIVVTDANGLERRLVIDKELVIRRGTDYYLPVSLIEIKNQMALIGLKPSRSRMWIQLANLCDNNGRPRPMLPLVSEVALANEPLLRYGVICSIHDPYSDTQDPAFTGNSRLSQEARRTSRYVSVQRIIHCGNVELTWQTILVAASDLLPYDFSVDFMQPGGDKLRGQLVSRSGNHLYRTPGLLAVHVLGFHNDDQDKALIQYSGSDYTRDLDRMENEVELESFGFSPAVLCTVRLWVHRNVLRIVPATDPGQVSHPRQHIIVGDNRF